MRQGKIVFITTLFIAMLPALYYAYLQILEERQTSNYLATNHLLNLPLTKETALLVAKKVRADFNVDEKNFRALNWDRRPFLREDTGFLLEFKEGACGEGTRVIVNLLNTLGFDATRVTLFNRSLQPMHTLVSVQLQTREFFVDSINSTEQTTQLLSEHDISVTHFYVSHYSANIKVRKSFRNTGILLPNDSQDFFSQYWLYSYEATPYTKIASSLGLDIRVFNFDRPPKWISSLAEKPNLVRFLIWFILAVITTFVMHWSGLPKDFFNPSTENRKLSSSNSQKKAA